MGTTRLLTPKHVNPLSSATSALTVLGNGLQRMLGMTNRHIEIVALAGCLVRVAWARLTSGQRFGVRSPPTPAV